MYRVGLEGLLLNGVVRMTGGYGVLRGRPDRWVREDDEATPHLQIRLLDSTGQPWRIAVNVQSDTGAEVVYWLVDPLQGHPMLAGLADRPTGFSGGSPSPAGALDYVRAPLFDWHEGTALPATGRASADDLQDLLELYLQHCKDAGGELYAFGVRFDRNLHKPIDVEFGNTDGLHGVHDIHLNQGNAGPHAEDNGAWHDGGLILAHPDRHIGLFLGFQTQRVPTDAAGAPTPQSQSIEDLIHGAAPPLTTVYLERALLNPVGDDVGSEAVVIGNLANTSASLAGWQLVDKTHRRTVIGPQTIGPGESFRLPLDGSGAQLGNNGGNLELLDPGGHLADAVAYTAADAVEDQYVRFRR
jgi:uncharacterized protein YukJ